MKNAFKMAVAGILALVVGCGQSVPSHSGSTDAGVDTSIMDVYATPSSVTMNVGESAVVSIAVVRHNLVIQTVTATWTNPDPVNVALTPQGDSMLIEGIGAASITLHAEYEGFTVPVPVTVKEIVEAGPGTIFGDDYTGLRKYPSDGSPSQLIYESGNAWSGCTVSRDGKTVYVTEYRDDGSYFLHPFDAATGATKPTAEWGAIDRPFGLDTDRQGRVLTQGFGDGKRLRYDPVTGTVEELTPVSGNNFDFAVGGDDRTYFAYFFMSQGAAWITVAGVSGLTPWARVPDAVPGTGPSRIVIPAGVAINNRGEAFIQDMSDNQLYRHVDVNGNGTALDAGETVAYAQLSQSVEENFTYGICTTRNDGVLLNVKMNDNRNTGAASSGIYSIQDLDGNGTAVGTTEITRVNPEFIQNGIDGGCVAARR